MKKKLHAGHLILLGGIAVLIFLFSLFYHFVRNDLSLVTHDYYGQELIYNGRQAAMQHTVPFDSLFLVKTKSDVIELTIPDTLNQSLSSGYVQFYFPAREASDKTIDLKPSPANVYTLDRPKSMQRFVLKIYLHAGSEDYYKEIKI